MFGRKATEFDITFGTGTIRIEGVSRQLKPGEVVRVNEVQWLDTVGTWGHTAGGSCTEKKHS